MTSGKSHFVFVRIFGISLTYPVVDIEYGATLPLVPLDTDLDRRHPGALVVFFFYIFALLVTKQFNGKNCFQIQVLELFLITSK